MEHKDMPEIWSIALTRDGLGACALGLDMTRRDYTARWPMMRVDRMWAVDTGVLRRIVAESLMALYAQLPKDEQPLAITICAPNAETACFLDNTGTPLSAIYLDKPPVMPRREIPERYAEAPAAAYAYRNSVLRCIQQMRPEFCMENPPGIASIGAIVAQALTGHLSDVCLPRGIPESYPDMDDDVTTATGLCPDSCFERIRCGVPFARISPEIAQNLNAPDFAALGNLAGVPVFNMGSSDSARAYASASDPLSWSVTVGTDLRAQWTAGIGALTGYEIQIVDSNTPKPESSEEISKTRDEWTREIYAALPIRPYPGPGKNLSGYGLHSVPVHTPIVSQLLASCSLCEGIVPFETLSTVPVGSNGLHIIPRNDDIQIIGLTSAHEPIHVARALFEGFIYTLRDWQNALESPGPVRIVIDKPWPAQCAQWIADILARPVFSLDEPAEILAAMGAALCLVRDLDLPVNGKPSLSANIIEPQPRAAAYQPHYDIHCALKSS